MKRNRLKNRNRRVGIENLENRQLMDGAGLSGGIIINERGTPLEISSFQRIEVTLRDVDRPGQGPGVEVDQVRFNEDGSFFGSLKSFHRNFREIQFSGSRHDDVLINESSYGVVADGNAGDDTLIGGRASDVLNGGDGNDFIDGRGGNDWIDGGLGVDRLTGGSGDDYIFSRDRQSGDVVDASIDRDTVVQDSGDIVTLPRAASVNIASSQGNEGSALRFAVTVKPGDDLSKTIKVHYRTESASAQSASGDIGFIGPVQSNLTDFTAESGILTFRGTGGTQDVIIQTRNDSLIEGDETFRVVITKVENGAIDGPNAAIGTIRDTTTPKTNDPVGPEVKPTPPPTRILAQDGNKTVIEGNVGSRVVLFRYRPEQVVTQKTVVRVRTMEPIGSTAAARVGQDYKAVDTLLTWQPGESHVQTVQVLIYGDQTDESQIESFRIVVDGVENAEITGNRSVQVGIEDDDVPAPAIPASLTFEHIREAEGTAGQRVAHATLRLSNPTNYNVAINYETRTGGAWGNAVAGEDFAFTKGTAIVPAGQTSVTIDIPVFGDNLVEADEYFHISLTAPDWVHVPNPHMGVTLLNDDTPLVDAHAVVFRNGTWFIDGGDGGSAERTVSFGLAGDTPLTGDFNGDKTTDLAVVRSNHASGMLDWYFDYSANGTLDATRQFGLLGDKAVAGDFNGDGETDVAVVREDYWTGGLDWYMDYDRAGFAAEDVKRFGNIGDQIAPGDFDGNGRTDFGVARKDEHGFLEWYMDTAGDGLFAEQTARFGLSTDRAIVDDWDGDGDDDFGVARVMKADVVDLLFDLTDGQDDKEERRIRYGWESDEFLSL